MKAVGVYIYAGGFAVGMKKAGFDIEAHLEDPEPYGKEIIRMNPAYFGDMPIHAFPRWKDYKPDVLFANPPCAPFSNANTRSFLPGSWKRDPRIACWHNTIEYIIKNDIPFAAIETVPQAYSKAPDLLIEKAQELTFAGYNVTIFIHNAMFMGSCQDRPRLIMFASKYKLHFAPFATRPMVTVGQRLATLDGVEYDREECHVKIAERYIPVVNATEEGERLRDVWEKLNPEDTRVQNERGQIKGRPTFGVKKLNRDGQMVVIVGYDLIHPAEKRFINRREYAILGDYPQDYNFPWKSSRVSAYVARGVSAAVGQWVGESAKLTLEKKEVEMNENLVIKQGLQGYANIQTYEVDIASSEAILPKISLRSRKMK
jgi:site-specific DNA-cytosine methylase